MNEEPLDSMVDTMFEFVAVKQEWVEDDVKDGDWHEAQGSENAAVEEDGDHAKTWPSECRMSQGPESAETTVDTARFIPQVQDRSTTYKCAVASAGTDDIPQSGSDHGDSWNKCGRNEGIALLPSEQAAYSESQGELSTCKDTSSATSTVSGEKFCKDASDVNCNRYQVDVNRERFSPSENGGVTERQSLLPAERDVYTCDVCREVFAHKKAMRSHVLQHLLTCDVCHRTCRDSYDLRVHYRTHTGKRPYRCDVCGEAFSRNDNLRQHSLRHTGEGPYTCDVCGRSFSRSTNLRQHALQHTGDRPYKCDVCHKRFTNRSNLAQHLRVHTGERPFRCDACGTSFMWNKHVKVYHHKHTGESLYACNPCGEAFVCGRALKVPGASKRRRHPKNAGRIKTETAP